MTAFVIFHVDFDDGDSFPVLVCDTKKQAEAWVAAQGEEYYSIKLVEKHGAEWVPGTILREESK